ncbi:hypothetical protein C5C94_16330 [Rathayibacter sp. AY1C3]|uniref:helix-turn-helix domain-containing protein n=1 Tax=Rathayibacter sp. AY1C3 TaxID=2080536 RepID=UPI000CE9021A|nr:helix-turn-helix domain-containing protein [Rathayibacter sp. AY1C3]PPH26853.1 hypothetical protein C5C94_16330 [Rathayibacter sp. AY1C3]
MNTVHVTGLNLHLRTPAAAVHFLLTGLRRRGRTCTQRSSTDWATTTRIGPAEIIAEVDGIGTALRMLRRRAGLSRRQAARIADTNPTTIALIELGSMRLLTVTMLWRLSAAYSDAIAKKPTS